MLTVFLYFFYNLAMLCRAHILFFINSGFICLCCQLILMTLILVTSDKMFSFV